jgi:hypothetical protein
MMSSLDGKASRDDLTRVQGDAPVVADDAPAPVRVRQAGDDVRAAGGHDLGGVRVEDSVVVGLAVLREDPLQLGVDRVAVGLEAVLDHPPAAVGHDRPLERRVGLQADDELLLAVDVARGVRGDRRRGAGVHVVDALLPLLREHRRQFPPDAECALGRAGEEGRVALVRGVVLLDEPARVDGVAPPRSDETPPRVELGGVGCWVYLTFYEGHDSLSVGFTLHPSHRRSGRSGTFGPTGPRR